MKQQSGLDLKVQRIRARVKAYEIAQAMGVSTSRVSALEREALLSEEMTRRYLEALGTCGTSGAPQNAVEVA